MNAIESFLEKKKVKDPQVVASYYGDVFDAMMEGAAMMLDLIGPIETTYTCKSGNKIHITLDSP